MMWYRWFYYDFFATAHVCLLLGATEGRVLVLLLVKHGRKDIRSEAYMAEVMILPSKNDEMPRRCPLSFDSFPAGFGLKD